MVRNKFKTEINKDFSLLDNHTSEVLEFRQTKKITLDEFIMVFFAGCPELLRLKGIHLKVLICCWKFSSYNPENEVEGNLVHNDVMFKEQCKSFGLDAHDASIDNSISYLSKQGYLIKKCRGVYLMNPKYFFKGSLSSRSKIDIHYIVEPTKK